MPLTVEDRPKTCWARGVKLFIIAFRCRARWPCWKLIRHQHSTFNIKPKEIEYRDEYQSSCFAGNLTAEPEVNYSPKGTAVVNASPASNEFYGCVDSAPMGSTIWIPLI